MEYKITIVGAGNVGATAAQYILEMNIADVVLMDVVQGLAQGKALDLMQTGPVRGFDARITGTEDYKDTEGSSIAVITAGLARKPGMSRDDLLMKNAEIVKSITEKIVKISPGCIIIVVTNPLDVMAYLCCKKSGFSHKKVIGMAGVLDSARLRAFVAMELGVSVRDVEAVVLGGHGDSMVPLPRYTTVSGKPIKELMPEDKINKILDRTKKAGGEIVAYLKTGSAFYSPGASIALMVESILKDKKDLLACSAYVDGEFGLKDVYIGVPVILGAGGVSKIVELKLAPEEKKALYASAEDVKRNISKLGI